MIDLNIPGWGQLQLKYLVMDYNGTLAVNGRISQKVVTKLQHLSGQLQLHIITADTFDRVRDEIEDVPCELKLLSAENQSSQKKSYVEQLGAGHCIALGNGRNDRLMIDTSQIGICVINDEGAARETLLAADVIVKSPLDALDLLLNPLRMVATLRD